MVTDMTLLKQEPPRQGARYATSIDIGTNTARFLVGEIQSAGTFRRVHSGGGITRLGAGLKGAGRLSQEKIDLTASLLLSFRNEIDGYHPEFIATVATSAAREASNGHKFAALVKKKTGLKVEIIDWEEEARRTLLGVFWKTTARQDRKSLIFDIGGGSTEFIISQGPRLLKSYGTNLGVVHLAESYIRSDPLNNADMLGLRESIGAELQKLRDAIESEAPAQMICTAGTPTTVAATHLKLFPYDPDQVHNLRMTQGKIQKIFEELRVLPLDQRKKLPWIEEGRADLILPGAQIILMAMELFRFREMIVSDHGLREGILIDALQKRLLPGGRTGKNISRELVKRAP